MLAIVIRSCAAVSGLGLAAWLTWAVVHASLAPRVLLPGLACLAVVTGVRPMWGVYATIAALPLLGRFTVVLDTAHFVPAEVISYAALSGLLLRAGVRGENWKPSKVDPWIVIWGVVIVCSVLVELKAGAVQEMPGEWMQRVPDLFTGYPERASLYPLRAGFTYLAGIAAFVLVAQSVRFNHDRERLIQILTAVSVFVCGYAVYQYVTGADLHLGVSVQSTLTDKATLGSYLALIIGLALGQTRSSGLSRAAAFLVLGVCVVGLFSNRSGNAWLAVAILLTIVIGITFKSFWNQPRGTVAIQLGALLLIIAGLAAGVAGNLDARIERGHLKRPLYWQASLDAMWEYPAWGVGVGRIFTMPYASRRGGAETHGHNDVLQVGAELGLIGMGAWLALLGCWYRDTRRQHDDADQRETGWAPLALLLGASGFLLAGLGEHLLGYTEQQLLLGSLLGAGVNPAGRPAHARSWWFAGGLGIFVVLSVLFRQPLP